MKRQTEEEERAELAAFDLKLYRAQLAMQDAMTQELKALGVPFFGTHAHLVLPDDASPEQVEAGKRERPKWSPCVRASDLVALKRRMISHLEDMYKD